MGYSSVLLGQLILFNGPLARYHLIRTVLWPLWLETLADCHRLGNLCKGLVASLCNHTSEVWYCAKLAHAWLGSKFFGTSTRIVVKLYNLCRVKTNRLAVLTIKSGLDPHMINKIKDGYKSHSGYFLWPCWVPIISALTLAYCCSEGEGLWSFLKMLLSSRRTQPPVDCLWSLKPSFPG